MLGQPTFAVAVRTRMCSSRSCFSSTGDGASVSRHCARCVFGKAITSRIDSAPVIMRHDAVQAEGDPAVRRRAVLQRVEQEAELLRAGSSGADAERAEHLRLHFLAWIRTEPPPISQPFSTMS